jgi:uncharacterized protein YbaR (Trm112 family)
MPGARRSVKLPLTELSMKCPHCQAPLIIATVMDVITFGQRTCPKCRKEFIIENNMPRMQDDRLKRPNQSVKPARTARKSSRSR